jgi:hypothetical protein
MQRKDAGQKVAPFRQRLAKEEADGPRHAARVWCQANREAIQRVYEKQPIDFFQDREADIWDSLFAVASVAIPGRYEELKRVAQRLSAAKKKLDVDESQGIRLLADICTVFEASKHKKLETEQLLSKLRLLPESAWDNEFTAIKLARLLRPFAVASRQLWIDERNRRGYEREDFHEAFARYLPTAKDTRPPISRGF